MRVSLIYPLVLFVALTLAGCSAASGASPLATGGQATSPAAAATSAPSSTEKGGSVLAATPPAPDTSAMATDTSDPTVAAIQAVIQKGDQEQQDAFASGDPTVMKDTSTSDYYAQLAQINQDMANNGISGIKLLNVEWGQVNVTGPASATATAYETWQTTYSDGSSDQSRELNLYTLVQEQGVWKIQADDHPNSDPNRPGTSPAANPPGQSAPTPPSSSPATGTDTSRNWAGYAASSGTYTGVSGTWTVPKVQSSSNGTATGATWVGIGGVNTRDLIQAGTEETTSSSGDVSYDAWIEMLPRASHPVPFAVASGDSVTVSINQQGGDNWLIQMKNNTTGESYQTTVQYQSSLSSVEWIEEAPAIGRRLAQIDDFGTIQFSAGTAVENGKTVSIAGSGAQPITMSGPGGASVVTPSVLSSDGQGFSVTKSAEAPAVGTRRGFGN